MYIKQNLIKYILYFQCKYTNCICILNNFTHDDLKYYILEIVITKVKWNNLVSLCENYNLFYPQKKFTQFFLSINLCFLV